MKITVTILILFACISCGKKNKAPTPILGSPTHSKIEQLATVTTTAPNGQNGLSYKVFVHHRSTLNPFKNRKDFDIKLVNDGRVILNNPEKTDIGTHHCDEYIDDQCIHKVIDIHISDGPYTSRALITISTIQNETYDITYVEHKKENINKIKKKLPFGKTQSFQISTHSNGKTHQLKWINVKEYHYAKISNEIFFKTFCEKGLEKEEIIFTTRLPRKSVKNKKIFTKIDRDDFRRSYDDFRGSNLIDSDIIFAGKAAASELRWLTGLYSRDVKLYMSGFFK